jgi:hypothetical protein
MGQHLKAERCVAISVGCSVGHRARPAEGALDTESCAAFLAKEWPKLELGALLPRAGRLLPVWHGINERYLSRVAPTLVDILRRQLRRASKRCLLTSRRRFGAPKAEVASTLSPSFDLNYFVARYWARGAINDSLGCERVDAEIMSIALRPGIEQLDMAIARSSFDRETAMVIGLLLGRHVAHEDNILATRVLAYLLRNPMAVYDTAPH